MEGLKELALYVKLIQKYMEFRGNISFRIEDFEKGTPAKITISEKDENGNVAKTYILYGNIDENIFSLVNETGNDVLKNYQKELKLSDKETELQMLEFTKIIKEDKEAHK